MHANDQRVVNILLFSAMLFALLMFEQKVLKEEGDENESRWE
jgi:hypothetical protein